MAEGAITLEIITPEQIAHSLKVDSAVVPTPTGYIAIWPNHAPLITSLDTGVMWYRNERSEKGPKTSIAISSGFMEVLDNKINIFAETAERGDEIDIGRAEAARRRAEDRLKKASSGKVDLARAQAALAKSMARLKAAGRS